MGIAAKKEQNANEKVTFDFGAPDVFVPESEFAGLRRPQDEPTLLRQTAGLLSQAKADATVVSALLALATEKLGGAEPKDISYQARAVKHLIHVAVQAAYPKPEAITRKDRTMYRAWQRHIDFGAPDQSTLTLGAVTWLHDILNRDVIGLPLESSDWSEGVLEYCEALIERTLAAIEGRTEKG